ncbi:MAG: N-acetyltransferase [Clostridiales bacterium]|nr:N-acetyltransferase [Clostridiales bacterium]
MEKTNITLRRETPADHRAVEALTREAFWNLHVPGCDDHYLVHVLRGAEAFIPELDFVAVIGDEIVGNIMYAKSTVALDAGGELPVVTFGPVSVLPEYQRQGVGRKLIEHTLKLAKRMGFPAVFIYGDPAYYSRLGFVPAERFEIGTADGFYHAALQVFILQNDALRNAAGRFIEDSVYHIEEAAAAAFDLAFPAKEKRSGTPSQLRFQQSITTRKPRK